jgi:hypothetical protein
MPILRNMRRCAGARLAWGAALVAGIAACGHARAADEAGDKAADAAAADASEQVTKLVEQLDRGSPSERAEAERALVELGSASLGGGDEFLALLPTPSDDMSAEVATRLARIRAEVQSRLARRNLEQTRVTLEFDKALLADVLAEFEQQTGNRVIDYRGEFAEEPPEKRVTVKVTDEPFWSALDRVLDEVNMSPYPYAEEGALALVERPEGTLRRFGRANYAGPFRIEPTNVAARRGLRNPEESGAEVTLELAWEPRLQPVALAQVASDLAVKSDDELDVPSTSDDVVFDVEVPSDSQGAEVTLPLKLPAREAAELASVKGRFRALVPGRVVDVKFGDLASAQDETQEIGGVKVTLTRAVKNQALWEFHVSVAVSPLEDGGQPARGWMFQNTAYLEDAVGERLEHLGFETTMQTDEETGFAYFYELPEGADIGDYKWVYRTPTSLVNLPVEFELSDIPLP